MALKANRVGVRKDQVDIYGRPIAPSFFESLVNDLPVWTDLPVWKKGTEQLLPVNDDEPDTSPILCDIEYPVADLKNNQYFTYRQSPTQKDGKAKIRGIRGKTLVWNQLNTSTGISKTDKGITFTNLENGFFTIVGTATDDVYFDFKTERIDYKAGHKYAILGITAGTYNTYYFRIFGSNYDGSYIANVETDDYWTPRIYIKKDAVVNLKVAPAVYDLTLMFGAGKEPSTVKEFTDLFPLPYYKYDAGSLLDFTGTKVKTTGKNLIPFPYYTSSKTENGLTFTVNDDGTILVNGTASSNTVFRLCTAIDLENGVNYILSGCPSDVNGVSIQEFNGAPYDTGNGATFKGFINEGFRIRIASGTVCNKLMFKPMVRYASADSDYEVYKSNETDLPISTFFPTGMKSAGAVYDELTPTRATTRVAQVDLGSLTWSKVTGTYNRFKSSSISTLVKKPENNNTKANMLCSKYSTETATNTYLGTGGISLQATGGDAGCLFVYDSDYASSEATAFKTALSGVMLNYELAVEDVQPTMSFDSE